MLVNNNKIFKDNKIVSFNFILFIAKKIRASSIKPPLFIHFPYHLFISPILPLPLATVVLAISPPPAETVVDYRVYIRNWAADSVGTVDFNEAPQSSAYIQDTADPRTDCFPQLPQDMVGDGLSRKTLTVN